MKCLNAFCFAKRKQLGQIFLLLFIWWIYSVLPKETSIGRAGKIKNINRSLQVIIKNPQFIMTVYLTFLQGNLFDKIGLPFHSKMSLHTLEFKHTVNFKQAIIISCNKEQNLHHLYSYKWINTNAPGEGKYHIFSECLNS